MPRATVDREFEMDFAHYLKHWKAAVLIYLAISILTDILCYFLNFDGVFYKGRFFSVTVAGPVGALSFLAYLLYLKREENRSH